jgi:hypothetical protein
MPLRRHHALQRRVARHLDENDAKAETSCATWLSSLKPSAVPKPCSSAPAFEDDRRCARCASTGA